MWLERAPSSWPGTQGYVGGVDDDTTGLETLGARQYLPGTGRFLSADPVLERADANQLNGYDYSGNDPVTNSDPKGLDSCATGGQGCEWNGSCHCYLPPGGGDINNPPTPEDPYPQGKQCGAACNRTTDRSRVDKCDRFACLPPTDICDDQSCRTQNFSLKAWKKEEMEFCAVDPFACVTMV